MSPRFSVVIPTLDRPGSLRTCLGTLAALDYPRDDYEIVVVDDGSVPPVAEVLAPPPDGAALTILRTATSNGAAAARNVGAARARGKYLVFTDDDCRVRPSWLRMLAAQLERTPDRLVGGRTLNGLPGNPWSTTSQAIVDMAYDFYNADPSGPRFFATNNMAVPADRFAEIGGFRAEAFRVASEDRELCDRWRHAGHLLAYAPEAIVEHAHVLRFASFCRQHFRYGRGAMRYHEVRAQRGSGRLWHDLPFHAQMPQLVRRATRGMARRRAAAVALRLLVWQACNAAGYVYERGRDRRVAADAPDVPAAP